jgi:hypothetical protein
VLLLANFETISGDQKAAAEMRYKNTKHLKKIILLAVQL